MDVLRLRGRNVLNAAYAMSYHARITPAQAVHVLNVHKGAWHVIQENPEYVP